jgi:hypothetical protein
MAGVPSRFAFATAAAAAAVLVVGLAALPAGALARDRTVASDRTAANVAAFGQGLVWSRTASDGAHLVLRAFGPPADVALTPLGGGLFDPDLGQDTGGSIVAVYTRCAGLSGRNCDVYQFDFERNRESAVPGASSARCSEFAPSIWDGTVAFARSGPRGCAGLYVKGPRGGALRLDSRVPADTDFRQGRVAYLLTGSSGGSTIRVFTIKEGKSIVVVSGVRSEGERTSVSGPTFAGRYLYFLFHDLRRKEFLAARSRAQRHSSIQFSDRKLPRRAESIAVDGRNVYYTNERGVYQATSPVPHFGSRDR